MKNNFKTIKNELNNFINKFKTLPTRDRQVLFLHCIMTIDKIFYDYLINQNDDANVFFSEVLRYGYPIFIRNFYDADFEGLPGIPLQALTSEKLSLCQKILWSCKTIGWIENIEENEKYKNFKIIHIGKISKVSFKKKYHWNEFLEKRYALLYSNIMAMLRKTEYDQLEAEKERILHKMYSMVFVWNNDFMGYNNDKEVELYFREYAELDSEQETDWDMFKFSDRFANIKYEDFVDSVTDFSGYAMKHIYFAHILKQTTPNLIFENLFYLCKENKQIENLISQNRTLSLEQSKIIFKCLSLGNHNKSLYHKPLYCMAPFVKISQTQSIQSIAGSLHSPFAFTLENISCFFKTDWSKNTANREQLFKSELYSIFKSEQFICIDRNIVISLNGKTKTDIDAVVVDKSSGEIALFQLKWQALTSVSARSLNSKTTNYNNETNKWVECVQNWISTTSEEKISNLLGVPKKYIQKEKIHLFVLGRQHGNYSGNKPPTKKCAWSQWYMFLALSNITNDESPKISQLYNLVMQHSPFRKRIIEKPSIQKIGEYRVIFGNWKLF